MKTVRVSGGLGLQLETSVTPTRGAIGSQTRQARGGFWPNAARSTPGTHTFTMEDSSTSGTTQFDSNYREIQPP